MIINYTILNPSGNITALVETPVAEADRIKIANSIMKNEPTCEQVGFLSFNEDLPDTVFVDMAGGEFCGNASMCAAIISGKAKVKCSGNEELMAASVVCSSSLKANEMKSCAKKHERNKIVCTLSMKEQPKGITHFVLEGSMERTEAEAKIKSLAEDLCDNSKAVGIMFITGNKLRPLVYVPNSGTLFWENSCASGSIAAGMYLFKKTSKNLDVDLVQPGGVINVKVSKDSIMLTEEIEILCRKEMEIV